MTKYAVTEYTTFAELEAAIEAIDNTTNVAVVQVQTYNQKTFALIVGGTGNYIDGGTA